MALSAARAPVHTGRQAAASTGVPAAPTAQDATKNWQPDQSASCHTPLALLISKGQRGRASPYRKEPYRCPLISSSAVS
jgi:hypothetical protein